MKYPEAALQVQQMAYSPDVPHGSIGLQGPMPSLGARIGLVQNGFTHCLAIVKLHVACCMLANMIFLLI